MATKDAAEELLKELDKESTQTAEVGDDDWTPPPVSMRHRGVLNTMFKLVEDSYMEKYPERVCQWCYAPQHQQDYSLLTQYHAMGYREVSRDDVDQKTLIGKSDGDNVRIGDLILLSAPKRLQQHYRNEIDQINKDSVKSIKRSYKENVEAVTAGQHSGIPRGDVKIKSEIVTGPLATGE